jgi:hypothetical protein
MMSLKSIMSVFAALVFSLMWSGLLSAQFTTASLNGNVVDP